MSILEIYYEGIIYAFATTCVILIFIVSLNILGEVSKEILTYNEQYIFTLK